MKAGRKRSFDKAEALDKAMRLFWDNGFNGTSIANLSSALGINTPSLYAAFGNKEQLFKESLIHYNDQYISPITQRFLETSDISLQQRLQTYLYGVIDVFTNDKTPQGCLLTKSVNESNSDAFPNEISLFLKDMHKNGTALTTELFNSKINEGDLKDGLSIEDLVNYLSTITSGLAVRARMGHSADNLIATANLALTVFPRC